MMKKEQQDKEYYKFRNYFAWSGLLIFLVAGPAYYATKGFIVTEGLLYLYAIMLVAFISGFFGNIRARLLWLSSLSIIFYIVFFIILLYTPEVFNFFLSLSCVILTVIAFILVLKSL